MAIFCEKAFKKTFEDEVSKKAYLKACKWLATNIFNRVELAKHIVFSIEKQCESELPTFVVTAYVKSDESALRSEYCKQCKTLHTIFYSIDGTDCGSCKARGYQAKLDKDIVSKKTFVQEIVGEDE